MLSATSTKQLPELYRILYVPTGEFCCKYFGGWRASTRDYLRIYHPLVEQYANVPDFIGTKRECDIQILGMCKTEYTTMEEFELVEVLEESC